MLLHYNEARTEEEAIEKVHNIIVKRMGQFFDASKRALADPTLKGRAQVERGIVALGYVLSGNACEFSCYDLQN